MTDLRTDLLHWSDDYLIGVEELDFEHKSLFEHLNGLQLELAAEPSTDEIKKYLEEIYVRIDAHFALEENYMRAHQFAKMEKHKQEHDDFLNGMRDIITEFSTTTDPVVVEGLFFELREWITSHVLNSDQELAAVEPVAS